jgi:hypothetical protein
MPKRSLLAASAGAAFLAVSYCLAEEQAPKSLKIVTGPNLTDGIRNWSVPDANGLFRSPQSQTATGSGTTPLSTDDWRGFQIGPIPTRWTVYMGPIPNQWDAAVIQVRTMRTAAKASK